MLKRSLISSMLAIALVSFSGCGSDNETPKEQEEISSTPIPFGDGTFSPFHRVATFDVVKNSSGDINYSATDTKVTQIATEIATYIATVDEPTTLGSDKFQGGNWIVAGVEGEVSDEVISEAILGIPTPYAIDPTKELTAENTKKIKLVELCNKTYASKALGVADVVDGVRVENGTIHSTALPCEIAIYSENDKIYVDMLNPEAIFTLFFTDTLFGEQMGNSAFANEMLKLPAQVKGEIQTIIDSAISDIDGYTQVSQKKGPIYSSLEEITQAVDDSKNDSPYVHYRYSKSDGTALTSEELKAIADSVTSTMTTHTSTEAGIHEVALENQLSDGSSWRAAREHPLTVPGGIYIVEACSPYYAKQAIGTGAHHATALPCEISFQIDSNGELLISYLDPHFMFGTLFKDSLATMSAEELGAFSTLPEIVFNDLKTIVDYTIDNKLNISLDISLGEGVEVNYNMLPNK